MEKVRIDGTSLPDDQLRDAIAERRAMLDREKMEEELVILRRRLEQQVPKRFRERRFANYIPQSTEQHHALGAVRTWVDAVLAGESPMAALVGPTGTGKSHLLYAAAWALFDGGRMPRCVQWYRFSDRLRWGYGPRDEHGNPSYRAQDVRDEWYRASICLIDDARPTSATDWDATELGKYSLHAYDEEVPVLLTTNLASLEAVMGPAPADRFTKIMVLGPSAR